MEKTKLDILTYNATAKTTLANSDKLALTDSADKNKLKSVTFDNFQKSITTLTNVDSITFDSTPASAQAPYQLAWDSTYTTLNVGLNSDVNMALGQEMPVQAYNNTGVAIADGIPVYISGRHGHIAEITPARSDSETTSCIFGLTTCDFGTTGDLRNGYVTTFGIVNKIKTNYTGTGDWGTTWAVGDKLYCSKTVAGQLTNVEPSAPHHADVIGTVAVVGAIGTGAIFVNINRHKQLEELSDVDGTPLSATGQIPVWNETSKYFDFDKNINNYPLVNPNPWRDQITDSLSLRVQGVGLSTNIAEGTQDFSTLADLNDYLYCNIQLNHDKNLASAIYPHIHWFQAQNNTPNWLLYYRWQVNGGAKVTAWTPLKCNSNIHTYVSGTLNQISYSAAIAVPVGTTVSDIIQFRIHRDNANTSTAFTGADPYTVTVGMTSFDVHFQVDSLGSVSQTSKT